LCIFSISAHAEIKKVKDTLAYLKYDKAYWQVFIKQGDAAGKKISGSAYDKSIITWLQDGENIFACGIQGEAEIINIKTGKSQPVTLPAKSINDAVISPDGKLILYSDIAKDATDNKLWLYEVASKISKPLFKNIQGRQYDPKWSVNGDSFYFVTGVANTSYQISQATLKNLQPRVVVHNTRYNLDVDESINGKLTYSSNLKNSFDIWIKDGSKTTQLTKTEGSESHPNWSSDETHIYFEKLVDGVVNIWSVNVSDSEIKQVTFSKAGARFPVVYKRWVK